MLTPEFRLSQDSEFVYITIRTPYVKVSAVDWIIAGNVFQFYVSPYYLRLTFEQELVENGKEKAQYNVDTGEFFVTLPKKERVTFDDLDMQTLLLSRGERKRLAAQTASDTVGRDSATAPILSSLSSHALSAPLPPNAGDFGLREVSTKRISQNEHEDGSDTSPPSKLDPPPADKVEAAQKKPVIRPKIEVLASTSALEDIDNTAAKKLIETSTMPASENPSSGLAPEAISRDTEDMSAVGGNEGSEEDNSDAEDADEEVDWEVHQQQTTFSAEGFPYGFDGKYSGVLTKLQQEYPGLTALEDPDHMSPQERRQLRMLAERSAFSPEHYLGDMEDLAQFKGILDHKTRWELAWETFCSHPPPKADKTKSEGSDDHPVACPKVSEDTKNDRTDERASTETRAGDDGSSDHVSSATADEEKPLVSPPNGQREGKSDPSSFTEKELKQLRDFRRVEVLTPNEERALLSVVDIVCAVCYEARTTESEYNVESAWTVSTLSSTLSFLDVFGSVSEVLYSSIHRMLCYPLVRAWPVILRVIEDVKHVFHLGKPAILQTLLKAYELLARCEVRYVLNDLYLRDLCIWIQGVPKERLSTIANQLNAFVPDRQYLMFNLDALEALLDADDDDAQDDSSSSDDDDSSSSGDDDSSSDGDDDSSDDEEGSDGGDQEDDEGTEVIANEEGEEEKEHTADSDSTAHTHTKASSQKPLIEELS